MTKISLIGVLLLIYLKNIRTAKILAVIPTPSISHQVVFRPLFLELARRGHDVTVVTTDPVYPPGQAPSNLTEIDVHDLSYNTWDEEFQEDMEKESHPSEQITLLLRGMLKMIVAQMDTEEIQNIIKKGKYEYDLLMLEAWVLPTLIYSHIFKAPVIHLSSFGGSPYNYEAVGAPTHVFQYPSVLRERLYNLSDWEKLQQLHSHWTATNNIWQVDKEADEVLKSIHGPDTPSLNELENNVDMLFLNSHPIWLDNQPVPPNVVYMGGIHMLPKKELPKDLQIYLDSSKNGVIYFSLGTNVIPSLLHPDKIKIFIKVFSQLPYDVIWKWDKDELPEHADNIKIFKWLPQPSLLGHPNIKLFITQGGLQSTDEAIDAGVPLIGIPMLADQWHNVEKYVHHGIGFRLDMPTLNEKELKDTIEKVIGDKRYRENVVRLRSYMRDQPQTPLDRAVWWTEYVLRHGGARQLRARGANVSWTEYLELELVAAVVISLFAILLILSSSTYLLWIFLRKKFFGDNKIKTS